MSLAFSETVIGVWCKLGIYGWKIDVDNDVGICNNGTHYLQDEMMGKRKKTKNAEYILVVDGFEWLLVLLDILNGIGMEVIKEEIEELWDRHIRSIISVNINTVKDDGRELNKEWD